MIADQDYWSSAWEIRMVLDHEIDLQQPPHRMRDSSAPWPSHEIRRIRHAGQEKKNQIDVPGFPNRSEDEYSASCYDQTGQD